MKYKRGDIVGKMKYKRGDIVGLEIDEKSMNIVLRSFILNNEEYIDVYCWQGICSTIYFDNQRIDQYYPILLIDDEDRDG